MEANERYKKQDYPPCRRRRTTSLPFKVHLIWVYPLQVEADTMGSPCESASLDAVYPPRWSDGLIFCARDATPAYPLRWRTCDSALIGNRRPAPVYPPRWRGTRVRAGQKFAAPSGGGIRWERCFFLGVGLPTKVESTRHAAYPDRRITHQGGGVERSNCGAFAWAYPPRWWRGTKGDRATTRTQGARNPEGRRL
jgi:hypothetical protein